MAWQPGWLCIAAFVGLSAARAAEVQPVPALALVWECEQRYDEQFHVRCVARRRDVEPADTPAPIVATRAEALSGITRDLRPVAQRGEAAVFAVDAWHVPLYALPLDGAFVSELLRSVLCGRVAACEIHYAALEVRASGYGRSTAPRRARP